MYAIDCHWQQRFIDAIKLSLKIKLAKYNVGIGLSLSRQPLYQCTKHACIFWMQRNDDRPRLCCSVLIKKISNLVRTWRVMGNRTGLGKSFMSTSYGNVIEIRIRNLHETIQHPLLPFIYNRVLQTSLQQNNTELHLHGFVFYFVDRPSLQCIGVMFHLLYIRHACK